jgi:hypothetical protein
MKVERGTTGGNMSREEIILEGTLKPDGTLELDQKPNLSPGRVQVVLRQQFQPMPPKGDWLQHLQRIRAEREAAGYPFMNEEEMTAYIEWVREGDRIDEFLREAGQHLPKLGQP